jgi:hypothetical protein
LPKGRIFIADFTPEFHKGTGYFLILAVCQYITETVSRIIRDVILKDSLFTNGEKIHSLLSPEPSV